jgi:putative oxidoreductase
MKKLFALRIQSGLLLLRILVGVLLFTHGLIKITNGVDGIIAMLSGKGIPAFVAYGVYMGEIIAPIALVIGYRARLASVVICINMLVVFLIARPHDIFALNDMGLWKMELAAFYLFGSIILFFTGAGKYAVSRNNYWD